MPPQSGLGMGIERIVAILMEQENLRDCVLFPLMKGKNNQKNEQLTPVKEKKESKAEEITRPIPTNLPTREAALALIDKYSTSTKQHLLQVGAIMEYFAKKL